MKNKLIILLLLLTTWQTQAQKDEYIPLAVENAQWLILLDWIETPYPDEYYGYKIMGDTTINDTTYKKVYKREFESVNQNYDPPYEMIDEYLYGVVRDDVENRRVYGRYFDFFNGCPDYQDYLMYDYSIQVGDTNTGSMCQMEDEYTTIDIYYGTAYGYDARFFELQTSLCIAYMLEGIGSDRGLFEPMYCFESVVWLERFCRDMTDQECLDGFIVDVEGIKNINEITLFPNPANDIISISNVNNLLINKIIISDITGKNIIEINEKAFDKINISNLNKGLYFISFYQENKLINTQKIIKN